MGTHRTCMRDQVRDAIVSKILDGTYAPGTRLKELVVARELNVSQAPVREAFRELAVLGLVETEHYRGTRVRGINLQELREAYELRLAIEEASARRAPPPSDADLKYLEADIEAMTAAARLQNVDAYLSAVVDFHRRIVQMSGNSLFLRAWEHMAWDIRARFAARRIRGIGLYDPTRARIVAALRKGDREQAARLVREIIEGLLAHIDRFESDEHAAA